MTPKEIDQKWQKRWEEEGLHKIDLAVAPAYLHLHFYLLSMFPYPSGNLHLGHWYAFTPADAYARFKRMQGHTVFFPMGFDAFGLPAENAAIKHGIQPAEWTEKNIERMTKQLKSMGCMFSWDHTLRTCDPRYYKWNQWIFLRFLENDLAYRDTATVDYCPSCQTTIAKEQIVEDCCERCKSPVVNKDLPSWKLRITKYREELSDFSGLDWPDKVIKMQKEWIKGLRDWNVSRQRMWGTPIPIIYCPVCGTVPVPDKDLPVLLPTDAEFLPTGESPLKRHPTFKHCMCPKCGGEAERETDTLDTFFCSSWYQYAYLNPYSTTDSPFDVNIERKWPVSLYTGGIEHACMHLLYFRFFTKAMDDCGILSEKREPARSLFNQGMILGPDHQKMSKSRGNVIDPDELVEKYGADVVRAGLMFIGPWDQGGPFDPNLTGIVRFLNDVSDIARRDLPAMGKISDAVKYMTSRVIQGVTTSMKSMRFNVAISWLMQFRNTLNENYDSCDATTWENAVDVLLKLLYPIAPHRTEELWQERGNEKTIYNNWPAVMTMTFNPIEVVIQVNGKKKIIIEKAVSDNLDDVLEYPEVKAIQAGLEIKRIVKVGEKLINFVVKRTIDD